MTNKLHTDEPLKNLKIPTLISAVESARNPLIITDNLLPDNPIIYCNQAFLDLTGYTMAEIIGHNCRFLQGVDTDPNAIKLIRDAVDNNVYIRLDLKNYKKDGTPFWNDFVMSPVKNTDGETTHFMGTQLDITKRIEMEENLAQQKSQLEQSNHELEQFTYATSHDLQEPLRMVSSYLQLLSGRYSDKLDDDGRTFLQFATEGAERMQDLINDLLSLSRVTTAGEKFTRTKTQEALDRAQFNLHLLIEETSTSLSIGNLPELVVDPTQITLLFQNLIGNAIKYRRPGTDPVIHISAEKTKKEWIFSVSDNGIGIPVEHSKRIFIVFQRLHTRSEYAGTGIGLAICSKILERHHGRIWVESVEGSGSTFKFALPFN